jgi:hypothetical protein
MPITWMGGYRQIITDQPGPRYDLDADRLI